MQRIVLPRRQSKKLQERAHLHRLLSCLEIHLEESSIEEGERPDFQLRLPRDGVVGIELTELIVPDQGKDRHHDHRLAALEISVVEDYLKRYGGRGALIVGHHHSVPSAADDLRELEKTFRAHLEGNGHELALDGGSLSKVFEHRWGRIERIWRSDDRGVVDTMGDGSPPPSYREHRNPSELTRLIGARVAEKARAALTFDAKIPLWLAIRNPNQRILGVPPELRVSVKESAAGVFERVLVFNDPAGVMDPRPPKPRYVDLFASAGHARE